MYSLISRWLARFIDSAPERLSEYRLIYFFPLHFNWLFIVVFNAFCFTSPLAVPSAAAQATATTALAQNAARTGNVVMSTSHPNYIGTGFAASFWGSADSITFTVNAPSAGQNDVTVRYFNGRGSTWTMSMYVNNVKIKQLGFLTLPDWSTPGFLTQRVTLNAGNNTVAYRFDTSDTGNIHINSIDVIPVSSPTPTPTPTPTPGPNVIQRENAKTTAQGVTNAWLISNYAALHEIEGYASATSVDRGGLINLYINTIDPSYSINIYRLGWYGGAGGRLVYSSATLVGAVQPPCPIVEPATSLVECNWTSPYTVPVSNSADPTDWASGYYYAKLTGSSGKQSYIMFVVRDDSRNTDLLMQAGVTTYQAYNNWGGTSLYGDPALGTHAYKVSFNRPYANNRGAGFASAWELNTLRFLEREGYDVAYSTNLDTHLSGSQLLNHKAFLSVGHDEYWTKQMYDAVESARDQGVSLAFFGANTAYWQARLEPSSTGQPNRTLVSYKEAAANLDPYFTSNPLEVTTRFRDSPLNRPEASLVGVMYDFSPVDSDIVIANCIPLICNGTTLVNGSRLAGMLGYEVDRIDASSPQGIQIIGVSPYVAGGQTRYSNMTYYTATSGAGVFATGSIYWGWGLDDISPFNAPRVNADVQQITRNVLNRFIGR
jgi:Carbohydrate binding module (family 35)